MRDARREQSVYLDRQTVRRKRNWMKRLRQAERTLISFAIIIVGLVALYGFYQLVFLGSTFAVKKIVVEGEWQYLTADGLAEVSGVKEGDNLFWVRVEEVHERLKSDPWVKTAAVQRRLPNALWVYVNEYRPKALLLSENGLYYVDDEGKIFKRVDAADDKNFPVITGIGLEDENGLQIEQLSNAMALMDLFRGSEIGKDKDIAEINYDSSKGYSIITKKEPVEILMGKDEFAEKISKIEKMFPEIIRHGGRIQYMMANEKGRIIVKFLTS